jgi:hypothetical protein
VVVFEDANNDGALNLDENNQPTENFAVSGEITAVDPTDVTLGEDTRTPYGEYTATAQLTDGTDKVAAAGVPVRFTRSTGDGVVEVQRATTDENGVATYTFSAEDPNSATGNTTPYTIDADVDLDNDGAYDDATDEQQVTFDDAAAVASNPIEVETNADEVRTGETVRATATVEDQYGNPVSGETVEFTVDQPTSADLTTTRTTDENGQASFSFNADEAGEYTVTVASEETPGVNGSTTVDAYDNGVENARTGAIFADVDEAEAAAGTTADSVRDGDTLEVFGNAEANGFVVDNADLEDLTIDGSDADAITGPISLTGVDGTTVKGFTVTPGEGTSGPTQPVAFEINDAQGFTISDNVVTAANSDFSDNERGIVTAIGGGEEQGTVSGNTFRRLSTGIYAEDTSDLVIQNNTFEAGNTGVASADEANDVLNNTFRLNVEGLSLIAPDVTVSENNFTGNDAHVSDYTANSAYNLEAVITANSFAEAVEVRPSTDAPGVAEQIVDEDAPATTPPASL